MKKILAAAGSALILLIPALSSAQTAPAVVKNIKTDFRATCNGVADDSPAFASFIAWAKQWQQTNSGLIELDLPSGSTCILYNPHWGGIKKLQIVGYGATLKGSFFLGVDGMRTGPDYRGKVQSVSAGSNSVTLLNAADAAKFKVGAWALMSGYDLQGLLNVDYGYPPNWEFMEYVQISSINRATVTFTAPLKYNYLSNWPSFNSWNGGPAQLNVLSDDWNIELEYKGLHISMPGQIYANGRTVTFTDVTFDDACVIPTQNKTWTFNNVTCNQIMEADKLVESVVVNGGTLRGFDFQSSSIDLLQMNGTTVTVFIHGTPKKAVISKSHIADLHVGTLWYGHTDEVSCTNCVIDSFGTYGTNMKSVNDLFTMNNDTIIVPKTTANGAGDLTWAVPREYVYWGGQFGYIGGFQILGVTEDANNVYVQTTHAGGWPSNYLWYSPTGASPGSALGIIALAAPKFTCTNCTGDPAVVDLSQAPAGAPLFSYSKRTYTGNTLHPYPDYPPPVTVMGRFVSLKINVTKPYTGTQSSLHMQGMDQFVVDLATNRYYRYTPMIDLKVAGERVVTAEGVTGAQAGDSSLSLPGPVIFSGNAGPLMEYGKDISAEPASVWPIVTVEIVTDQGI